MQWAALNDPAHRDGDAPGRSKAVTSEAEESRLTSKYESALLHIRAGEREAAVGELGAILEHPMMSEPPTHLRRPTASVPGGVSLTPTMTQIKFLSLKTLGRLVAELADERHAASDPSASASESESYALALRCYAAAVEIDGADSALWRRLGALAVRRGQPHVARHALRWASPCTRGTRSCSRTSRSASSPSATSPRASTSRASSPPWTRGTPAPWT